MAADFPAPVSDSPRARYPLSGGPALDTRQIPNRAWDASWPAPRFLVLGGGAVVGEYYAPALRVLGWASEATIYDPDPRALGRLRLSASDVRLECSGFEDALAMKRLTDRFDAAVIALPNHLHEAAVSLALKSGLHVLCEKPLALSRDTCHHLADLAASCDRVLAVGMVRRLLPSVRALRDALTAGLLGDLTAIDIEDGEPYAWLSDSGAPFRPENGGVVADMGIHYLDLVESVVGRLTPTSYWDDSEGGVEANAEMHLQASSGVSVRLVLSRTFTLRNTAIFQGEGGELQLEKNTSDCCLWRSSCGLTGQLRPAQPFSSRDWPLTLHSCFTQQFVDFAMAIRAEGSSCVNAREAASTVRLVEWAYQQRRTVNHVASPTQSPGRPSIAPSPVTVTGGTGFVGANLVQRLAELECGPVTVPVRNYRRAAEVSRMRIHAPRVDLLSRHEVAAALSGSRYIFHLAYGREGEDAARVTTEGTQNVVEAGIEAGAESVVVLSTMYVFGHPNAAQPVDESFPYAPAGGEYGESKATMERWCLERAKSSPRTRIVILNPSCVYGPGGKTYTSMPITMAREGRFCWVEGGRGVANVTYVGNLVDAMLLAATCPEAHGQRFIINDTSTTWRSFLEPLLGQFAFTLPSYSRDQLLALDRARRASLVDVAKILGKNPDLRAAVMSWPWAQAVLRTANRRVPSLTERIRAASRPPSGIESATSTPVGVPPVWLADLFGPTLTSFSAEKARDVLRWEPRVDIHDAHDRTVKWLRYARLLP